MTVLLATLILVAFLVILPLGFIIGQDAGILGLPILFPTPSFAPTATPIPVPHFDPFKIYNLINGYRASKGLNKLSWDPSICDYANTRLEQIHTDWSHRGFLSKYPPYQGPGMYAGENLAKGEDTEQNVITDWLNSPEHLANIIKTVYDRTCITTDTISDGTTYTVQEFVSN